MLSMLKNAVRFWTVYYGTGVNRLSNYGSEINRLTTSNDFGGIRTYTTETHMRVSPGYSLSSVGGIASNVLKKLVLPGMITTVDAFSKAYE